MTISERINLHRCGYSRAEIDELAKQEQEERNQKPEPEQAEQKEPKPEPEQAEQETEERDPVLEAINKLTEAIQGKNINSKAQPETPEQTMNDLIKQV